MNESIIIQKLIQVGQMLERGKLGYSGAEIDTKHYLEQYVTLRQPSVVGRSEQLVCDCVKCKPFHNESAGYRKHKFCVKNKAN